jgi:class 3 adenylate cyclase
VSFRTKLLLAMMVVVAGVSGTTLYVLQQRVQANYARLFRTQFERQLGFFIALQDSRLEKVKEQTLKLSQSPPVITALSGTTQAAVERVYLTASNEMRSVLVSMFQEARLANSRTVRRYPANFVRFLDQAGRTLDPPEGMRRQMGMLNKRLMEQKLAGIRGVLQKPERQQIGYLDLTREATNPMPFRAKAARAVAQADETGADTAARPQLQEIIVTKIITPDTGQLLGAIVIGFPVADLLPVSRATNSVESADAAEPFQRGILLEGHLYANTNEIPETSAAIAAAEVERRIQATAHAQDDFAFRIQDRDYQIFYQQLNPDSAFPPAYQVCLYSMDEAQREQSDLRWKVLGSSAAGIVVAFFLSLILANGFSVPLRSLVKATGEIQRGNFDVRVPVKSRDEIGRLAGSFNEMAEGLAQKELYRTVLNLVADEKVAHELVQGNLMLGGEERDVTVLFCDIRAFTELTQGMPPGEVIEMLNEHMTALTAVVKSHNGVLDKFVGDLLMAVFGAPMRHGDDTLQAVRCALRLQEERQKLNQTSRHQLQVGIGVATGKVVAGCMGSTERLNYTVVGERVNLASRLCDEAGPGEVFVDQSTLDALGDLITVAPVAPTTLKGFPAPVQVYKLCGMHDSSA